MRADKAKRERGGNVEDFAERIRKTIARGPAVVVWSEARFRMIEESLSDHGINLDAPVGAFNEFDPGKPRWWLVDADDPVARRQPLRDALQLLAWHHGCAPVESHERLTTPARTAESWQKTVAAVENARSMILDTTTNNTFYTKEDCAAASAVDDAMGRYAARLRERIAKLGAMQSPRSENARTRHNDYWRELTRLWRGITGGAGPKRRQRLRNFLCACTPPTMFPGMTARQLSKKLESFVNNCFR